MNRKLTETVFENYQEAFVKIICDLFASPQNICPSRNGNMHERLGVSFKINNPSEYEFADKGIGRLTYEYGAHFYDWMMSGSSKEATAEFLKKYPQTKGFLEKPTNSNLPANFNSFYGERILRQLPAIKKELQNENSRRAVLNILNEGDQILFDAVENDMTEYPCCDGVTLNIRDGKLYQHVNMRSNNMGQVAKLDMYLWGRFQTELAAELNVEVGYCTWSIASAHIFQKDFEYFYNSGILNYSANALITNICNNLRYLKEKFVTIGLVRHAASQANIDRILQGVSNTDIVPDKLCFDTINAVDYASKVYTSTIGRAIDTAKRYTSEFEETDLLNEMNWGHLDGKVQVGKDFINWMDNFAENVETRYYTDSESGLEMYQRLALFVNKLVQETDVHDNVVIFGHGIPLCALACAAQGKEFSMEFKLQHEKLVKIF